MSFVNCANCGMEYDERTHKCPKCDTPAYSDNRNQTLTVDIAHHGETLDNALQKLSAALTEAQSKRYGRLRLIVGSGKINSELARDLEWSRSQGVIKSFQHESSNQGAYILRMNFDD